MSLTTFPTESGHCVQITSSTVIEGTLRISGYGPDVQTAKLDAIDKLRKYLDDKKKHGKTFHYATTQHPMA